MNDDYAPPIIRLELDFVAQRFTHALMTHRDSLNEYTEEAIKRICTEDNIRAIVMKHAQRAVDEALKREIENLFLYGEGKVIIKRAVNELLGNVDVS